MSILNLESYRSKGINAYLEQICGGSDQMDSGTPKDYGTPATQEDAEKAHRSKAHTIAINLGAKPDGGYKYKEANGHKTKYGWLSIRGGEIVAEFASESELMQHERGAAGFELPELEGTEKQIVWATAIRDKFIAQVGDRVADYSPKSAAYEALYQISHAKIWIDNRDKLSVEKFVQKVAAIEAEWAETEKHMNLQDAVDTALYESVVHRDDEVLAEAQIYAIVYGDRVEVTANITGAGDKIPSGRKYIGGKGDMRWQYDLGRLDDIKRCRHIDFILDENGNEVSRGDVS
jgi:hypothetical protein